MNRDDYINVNGYILDKEQKEVVLSNFKNILVIAGAGCGKSLTIVGKIKYLIENNIVKSEEILCISFTNASCESLKNSINKNNINVDVMTFHRLSLNILKLNNINVSIVPSSYLDDIIDSFFYNDIYNNLNYILFVLKYYKIGFNKNNYIKKYEEILKSNKIISLKKIISTFIKLFKSSNYNYSYLEKIINKTNNFINRKYMYLMFIIVKIMNEYQNELKTNSLVDFDDMIILATKLISETNDLKYKYIIIDEFQDTSILRYNLIYEILKKTNSNFLAVGDDYQSIYRFTGCDLSLFINFKKYFSHSKIYKIQTTYRNSKELIKICGNFIKKNQIQIRKKLISNKSLNKPIKIIYYNNQAYIFNKLIEYLYKNNKKNLLLLVRNNNDIKEILGSKYTLEKDTIKHYKYNDLIIKFLTVHKSKGLEADTVIILSLINDIWGFPNKIKDEKILKYVLPKKEKYKYAEERRLFYVALTRTKNEVYLLVNKKLPSIFVKEILKISKNQIEIKNV